MNNKSTRIVFVLLEIFIGIVLSFVFLRFTLNDNNDKLWGKTFADGIIRIYGVLSLIFFFSVFLVGIIGAYKLNQSNKIGRGILYSFLFWLVSLIASAFLAQFGGIPSVYIILIGIVAGFNLGLGFSSQYVSRNSETSKWNTSRSWIFYYYLSSVVRATQWIFKE